MTKMLIDEAVVRRQLIVLEKAMHAMQADMAFEEVESCFNELSQALEQPPPAQRKYRRGDRFICLETGDFCWIHIAGTNRQWVKFPDTTVGVYTNEQLAELFELLPKEIEQEQPAPAQEPVACLVETEQGVMVWPIQNYDEASSYCGEGEWPVKLYTTPPAQEPAPDELTIAYMSGLHDGKKRKPLTDEQIFNLADPFGAFQYGDAQGHKRIDFARAIEAAHGITGENR